MCGISFIVSCTNALLLVEQAKSGTNRYYPDYKSNTCKKDCGSGVGCGGVLKDPSEATFKSASECCAGEFIQYASAQYLIHIWQTNISTPFLFNVSQQNSHGLVLNCATRSPLVIRPTSTMLITLQGIQNAQRIAMGR